MIIGKNWTWAHLPKTGGTSITKMLNLFNKEIIWQTENPEINHGKHNTFIQNKEKLSRQHRIINIRRLPDWILSFMMHFERCNNLPFDLKNYKDGNIYCKLGGKEQWVNIDKYLKSYINIPLEKYSFIRMELLAKDFIDIFSNYFTISKYKKGQINKIYEGIGHYKKEKVYFNDELIHKMYNDCPFWQKIEKYAYNK